MNKSEQDGIRKPRFQKTNFENFLFTLMHHCSLLFIVIHYFYLGEKFPGFQDIMMSSECLHITSNNSSNTKTKMAPLNCNKVDLKNFPIT